MIKYGDKAIKEISRSESNGIVTVEEKIIIHVVDKGDLMVFIGWNGLSRKRSFLSKSWAKNLRHINNKVKGNGLSNPTTDNINPTLATTSK